MKTELGDAAQELNCHYGPVVSDVLQHHVSNLLSFEVVDAVVSEITTEGSWDCYH